MTISAARRKRARRPRDRQKRRYAAKAGDWAAYRYIEAQTRAWKRLAGDRAAYCRRHRRQPELKRRAMDACSDTALRSRAKCYRLAAGCEHGRSQRRLYDIFLPTEQAGLLNRRRSATGTGRRAGSPYTATSVYCPALAGSPKTVETHDECRVDVPRQHSACRCDSI